MLNETWHKLRSTTDCNLMRKDQYYGSVVTTDFGCYPNQVVCLFVLHRGNCILDTKPLREYEQTSTTIKQNKATKILRL